MYFSSLKYTSPTFVTSMLNTVASITFVVAVVLRLEIVDVRTLRGLAKIAGTAVSLAGVTTISLYRGAAVKRPWRAPAVHVHGIGGAGHVEPHESWVKGSLLALASCICWSICFILQAGFVHKEVPGQAVSDGVDVPGRRPAVGGLRGVRAAGRAGLARRLRPQLLGHRVRGT
ncbi:WAT1-related protein [Zea mays]|uniref:WAT1-related protein n=1 Tax=Zea mays TaxID=4577 RepID=A0A1D6K5U5_MAIZE|nr:WAT1-related protein [Zea mays]